MSREYCNYMVDLLSPWSDVTARAMFGGFGLYSHGQIFAIVIDDDLYFKVDAGNMADYKQNHSEPFSYQAKTKIVTMSYWQVPLNIMEDNELLEVWAEKAYQAALRSKASKPAKKKKAK